MNEYIVEAVNRQWQDERRAEARQQRLIARFLRHRTGQSATRQPAALQADTAHRITTL
jgi:hypothetical protein